MTRWLCAEISFAFPSWHSTFNNDNNQRLLILNRIYFHFIHKNFSFSSFISWQCSKCLLISTQSRRLSLTRYFRYYNIHTQLHCCRLKEWNIYLSPGWIDSYEPNRITTISTVIACLYSNISKIYTYSSSLRSIYMLLNISVLFSAQLHMYTSLAIKCFIIKWNWKI